MQLIVATYGLILVANTVKEVFMSSMPRSLLLLLIVSASASASVHSPLIFHLPAGSLTLGDNALLFEIYSTTDWKDKNSKQLTNNDFGEVFEKDAPQGSRILVFSKPPEEWGGKMQVHVQFHKLGCEVLARISILSESEHPICLVRFPVMDTPPVNRYDTLLFPHHCGDAIHDPRVMISTRLGGIYSRRYPADVGLQYMTLYNEARNYYIAAYHDGPEFYDFTVRSATEGKLRLSLDWYPFLENGGKWESPQCSLAVLAGDWHSAADLYREHMGARFRPPTLPKWMTEDFHGWIQFSMKGGDPTPAYRYADLPRLYKEKVAPFGLNTMHVFSWSEGGFRRLPDFVPASKCGTADELRQAMDEIRAMGGHVDLYTHGSAIDPVSDYFKRNGTNSCVIQEDGAPLLAGSADQGMFRVCPSATIYQDHMVSVFARLISEYHAHGTQIDTNACIPAQFCFSKEHGHSTPTTGWLPGMDSLFRRIHEAYRRLDPDFFVWVEGVNERFGQFYEINQGHGENQAWTAGEGMPEMFHYTYPTYLCTGGSDSLDGLCHTYGQGKPFDIHYGPRLTDPIYTGLLKDFVLVRKQEPEYFLRGIFKDTVGVTVAGRDVRYWRIDSNTGKGMLVNLWARGRAFNDKCDAAIRLPDGMTRMRTVYPSSLRAEKSGDWYNLVWTGPVATLVFEK